MEREVLGKKNIGYVDKHYPLTADPNVHQATLCRRLARSEKRTLPPGLRVHALEDLYA